MIRFAPYSLPCLAFALLCVGSPLRSQQASTPTAQPATATTTATRHKKKTVAKKTTQPTSSARPATQTLQMESAPPDTTSAAGKSREAQQRAADQQLLQQQETQSDKAAQINDQQVERAQKRVDAAQNQIRVQDAPGPAQTGVVPAAGAPVTSTGADPRAVQDAPGPTQTLPPATSVNPSQLPAPPTLPQN